MSKSYLITRTRDSEVCQKVIIVIGLLLSNNCSKWNAALDLDKTGLFLLITNKKAKKSVNPISVETKKGQFWPKYRLHLPKWLMLGYRNVFWFWSHFGSAPVAWVYGIDWFFLAQSLRYRLATIITAQRIFPFWGYMISSKSDLKNDPNSIWEMIFHFKTAWNILMISSVLDVKPSKTRLEIFTDLYLVRFKN